MDSDKTTLEQRGVLGGVTGKGFLPGKSGNPLGRPRTADFAEVAREVLAEEDPKKRKTKWRLIVEKTVSLALQGSVRHLEILLDRTEGRVKITKEVNDSNRFAHLTDEELHAHILELLKTTLVQIRISICERKKAEHLVA